MITKLSVWSARRKITSRDAGVLCCVGFEVERLALDLCAPLFMSTADRLDFPATSRRNEKRVEFAPNRTRTCMRARGEAGVKTGGRPKRSLRVLLVLCVVSTSYLVNSRHSSMFSFHPILFAVIARVVTSLASSVAFARLTRRRGCSIWWRTRVRVFAINISQSVAPPLFFIPVIHSSNPCCDCVYIGSLCDLQRTDRHNMPTDHNLARDNPKEFAQRLSEKLKEVLRENTKKQMLMDLHLEVSDTIDVFEWVRPSSWPGTLKKTRSCTDQFTHVLYGTPVQCERWVCRHSQLHSIGRSSVRPFVSSPLVVANFSCYRSDFILLKLHYKCYTTLTLCRSQASATSTQYITCAFFLHFCAVVTLFIVDFTTPTFSADPFFVYSRPNNGCVILFDMT